MGKLTALKNFPGLYTDEEGTLFHKNCVGFAKPFTPVSRTAENDRRYITRMAGRNMSLWSSELRRKGADAVGEPQRVYGKRKPKDQSSVITT